VPELGEAEALYELGLLLEAQGDLAGAEKAYRRADDAGHTRAACKLGALLEERSARSEAEAAYARADQRGDANGAFNLGRLLEQAGATDRAEAAYRRADERGHPAAGGNLGILLERRGERTEARAAYEQADRRGDANSALNLGILLEDLGDRAGARAAYRRARRRGVPRAALPPSSSRRRRLATALAIGAAGALGAGIAGLELTHTPRPKRPEAAARIPNPAPSVTPGTTISPLHPTTSAVHRKPVVAHPATRHAVRHPAAAPSHASVPVAIGSTVAPRTHPTPLARSGGLRQSSSGAPAIIGAGSVGTGSTSLARSGGGDTHHPTPSTGSHPSGGTGTVSGGDG
jgi:hypothetical protein